MFLQTKTSLTWEVPYAENVVAENPPAVHYAENAPQPALLEWCEASLNIYVQDHRVG